jgi:hypothetical protein
MSQHDQRGGANGRMVQVNFQTYFKLFSVVNFQ